MDRCAPTDGWAASVSTISASEAEAIDNPRCGCFRIKAYHAKPIHKRRVVSDGHGDLAKAKKGNGWLQEMKASLRKVLMGP